MIADKKSLRVILRDKSKNFALVIGNGVNRFPSNNGGNSWDEMLVKLWEKHVGVKNPPINDGISLTEFYDVLELKSADHKGSLQKEFCLLINDWQCQRHHKNIAMWAKSNNTPILTTNFETTLSSPITNNVKHLNFKKFGDYYPWSSYYSDVTVSDPSGEFAVWHINGIQKYTRSIRLGLSHYIAASAKARKLIHDEKEGALFLGKNVSNWKGYQTWLHIIFNNDLIIFGLGLHSTEVFIRWLLIERAKYFKKYREKAKNSYYVYAGDDITAGQKLFLQSVGFEIHKQESYDSIYIQPWE